MKEECELNIECKICGRKFKSLKALSSHICQAHKVKVENYYLQFIGEKGKCLNCGKDTKYLDINNGYRTFCSPRCSTLYEGTKEKTKKTNIEKYGIDNYSKTKEYREKYIKTCNKRYDCDNPMQVNKFKEKCQQTCFENNGVYIPFKSPKVIEKSKETCIKNSGFINSMKNKKISNKVQKSTLRNNNGIHPCKLTYTKLKEKYPDLVKVEGLKEGPNGEILAHCKNSNCKNSKENGSYFKPTTRQIYERQRGINGISGNDVNNLYCCEECKKACPLFGKSATQLHNLINEDKNILYTSAEYSTWREEVLHRQRIENNIETNFCEYCHSTENIRVHHEVPVKLEPGYSLDPNNGIIVCEKCHYEKGHKTGTECSTGNLANKICK